MAQRGGNKGGGQRRGNDADHRKPTSDQLLADQAWVNHRTGEVIKSIEAMRLPIEAVLPVHVSFDKYRALALVAIRSDYSILLCTTKSIVTALLRCAHDGLAPDKREAVIVKSWNGKAGCHEARYQSMVAGLRKQILAGGIVSDVLTTIVYKAEIDRGLFKVKRGTDPSIDHDPLSETERGEAVAAYAVAFYHDGRRPTFEVMYRGEIYAVRDSSQTGDVWKGAHELEMWRKTVLRRFRKSLPGGNDIIDMEAREMFPDFGTNDAGPALPATARPTRAAVQERLSDQSGTGLHIDFGDDGLVEFAQVREEEQLREQHQSRDTPAGEDAEGRKEQPRGDAERRQEHRVSDWPMWQAGVIEDLARCEDVDAINALRQRISATLDTAPKEVQDAIDTAFSDELVDLTTGGKQGDR